MVLSFNSSFCGQSVINANKIPPSDFLAETEAVFGKMLEGIKG